LLRILPSRSVAEADTEVVAVVVPMEVEAEAASTVVEAEVASTVAVEEAERIAAVVVACTAAADRRVTRLEVWARTDAAAVACMAARVQTE
jgi:K+/H+ antiporter YhaU regulatory subunit KhtT